MTHEINNGWIVGRLPGPNGTLIPVKHFPQGPYERRLQKNPLLCLHTTETNGYVEQLRFPSEFQVGEEVIGQHRPLWARGSAVDEHDHDLLQIEIVEFSKLDPWLPKPSSLTPLVALMALLHRRGFVATALRRPDRWPIRLGRLPAAVDTYYRRFEVWDDPHVYGHVEIPGDEHWDPGSLDYPVLFSMVRDVLAPKGGRWRGANRQPARRHPVCERDAAVPRQPGKRACGAGTEPTGIPVRATDYDAHRG
jgi:hypothetical protein